MKPITRHGTLLMCDGRPWRGVVVNAFYLQEEAARGRVDVVDEVLDFAAGANGVVRVWAFNDDPNKRGDTAIQATPGKLEERGLAGLDLLIERAQRRQTRLLLVLGDHWRSYGGGLQYARWLGHADAVDGDVRFYSDGRALWAGYVTALLSRRNRRTAVVYGDEPAILGWELRNEPRGRDSQRSLQSGLADWVEFAAQLVRRHARQLIAVGDEGEETSFDGYDESAWHAAAHLFAPATATSFTHNAASPTVDIATCHLYPLKYGMPPELGERWIRDHAAVAARLQKPLIVDEFGLPSNRVDFYRRWLDVAAELPNVAAIGPWLFVDSSRPRHWDEHSFGVGDPEAALLQDLGRRFAAAV